MRKLYRSNRDSKLFGVCGGLAEYLSIDATLLRILLVVVTVFSAGSVVLVYIIAGFIIPREPNFNGGAFSADPFGTSGGWRPNQGGWTPPPQQGANGQQAWQSQSAWSGQSRPAPAPTATTTAHTASSSAAAASSTLDAMMEDIEKKAMKQEIEELKARINKFEQQSKGE